MTIAITNTTLLVLWLLKAMFIDIINVKYFYSITVNTIEKFHNLSKNAFLDPTRSQQDPAIASPLVSSHIVRGGLRLQ
jgi:hypothetical protein